MAFLDSDYKLCVPTESHNPSVFLLWDLKETTNRHTVQTDRQVRGLGDLMLPRSDQRGNNNFNY